MQKAVTPGRGTPVHHNLDPHSSACLTRCREIYQENGRDFSGSTITRRALRLYADYLKRQQRAGKLEGETTEILRAAKGVA